MGFVRGLALRRWAAARDGMSELSTKEMFERFTVRWGRAVEEGRLDDAILDAIFAWFMHRGDRDAERGRAALILLRSTIDRVLPASKDAAPQMEAEPHCSFCDKPQHAVKQVIVGSDALICDECVAMSISVLAERDADWREEQARLLASGTT
jgi:hypothetical protein